MSYLWPYLLWASRAFSFFFWPRSIFYLMSSEQDCGGRVTGSLTASALRPVFPSAVNKRATHCSCWYRAFSLFLSYSRGQGTDTSACLPPPLSHQQVFVIKVVESRVKGERGCLTWVILNSPRPLRREGNGRFMSHSAVSSSLSPPKNEKVEGPELLFCLFCLSTLSMSTLFSVQFCPSLIPRSSWEH